MVAFLNSLTRATAVSSAAVFVPPKSLDTNSEATIKSVAATLAYGAMSMYHGNVTDTASTLAVWPSPVYWWESGAAWGSMLHYSHYTQDASYDAVITQALLSQVGPDFDFMVPAQYGDEGNDDQAFWSFTILEAAERNWPQPDDSIPPWLTLAENIWNSMVVRWNTTSCGGGFLWQIFASNANGLSYKNSVSNGGFFQLSARLARDTGNQTYLDWAEKVWDWTRSVGFVSADYVVYDGADTSTNCSSVSALSFSYSQGIFLYGAAVMYNHTGDAVWSERALGLLKAADAYFSPYENATNVMYEHACETVDRCDTDMLSFKAYLSRFMWATTQMMPSTYPAVYALLNTSAVAAGTACSGGANGTTCGAKWYIGGYDGNAGLGQQLSALETVQGLLVKEAAPPLKAGQISRVKGDEPSTSSSTSPTESPVAISPVTSTADSSETRTADSTETRTGGSSETPTATSSPTPASTLVPSASRRSQGAGGLGMSWKSALAAVLALLVLKSTV